MIPTNEKMFKILNDQHVIAQKELEAATEDSSRDQSYILGVLDTLDWILGFNEDPPFFEIRI